MTSTNAARRAHRTAALLDLTQLGYAQWFFGNVYEAVVRVPDRLSDPAQASDAHARSVLGPGSPVRYYLPALPVTVVSTIGAIINGRGNPRSRRWLTVSAGCGAAGTALTGYVVRTVNLKLFFAAEPPPAAERDALLRTWYRVNVLRAAAVGCAMFATQCAKQASLKNAHLGNVVGQRVSSQV
jgi:hypothetical protein